MSNSDYIGKICPVCHEEIKQGEKVVICPSCEIPHHSACWESNKGCSTFGCSQQGVFKSESLKNDQQQIKRCKNCGAELTQLQEKCHKCGLDQNEIKNGMPYKVYNVRQKRSTALIVLAIICFIFSGIMLMKGIDKMVNYDNPDFAWADHVNAYVGGDAYNYIINGTYSTSFFVLASGGFIAGIICVASNEIICKIPQADRIE